MRTIHMYSYKPPTPKRQRKDLAFSTAWQAIGTGVALLGKNLGFHKAFHL